MLAITPRKIPSAEARIEKLKDIILRMDELNKTTLAWIIIFIKDVVKQEEHNKMSEENICLMFAPNLFKLKSAEAITEMHFLTSKIDLVKMMMGETNLVFGTSLIE